MGDQYGGILNASSVGKYFGEYINSTVYIVWLSSDLVSSLQPDNQPAKHDMQASYCSPKKSGCIRRGGTYSVCSHFWVCVCVLEVLLVIYPPPLLTPPPRDQCLLGTNSSVNLSFLSDKQLEIHCSCWSLDFFGPKFRFAWIWNRIVSCQILP
jgi:hypothetical protein